MCPRAVYRSTYLIFALLWLTVILASPIPQDAAVQQSLENAPKEPLPSTPITQQGATTTEQKPSAPAAQENTPDSSNHAEIEKLRANPEASPPGSDPSKPAQSPIVQIVRVEQKTPEPAKVTLARGDYPAIEQPRTEQNVKPVSAEGQAQNNAPAETKDQASAPAVKTNEPPRLQLFDHPAPQTPPKKTEPQTEPKMRFVQLPRIQLFGRLHAAKQQTLAS